MAPNDLALLYSHEQRRCITSETTYGLVDSISDFPFLFPRISQEPDAFINFNNYLGNSIHPKQIPTSVAQNPQNFVKNIGILQERSRAGEGAKKTSPISEVDAVLKVVHKGQQHADERLLLDEATTGEAADIFEEDLGALGGEVVSVPYLQTETCL